MARRHQDPLALLRQIEQDSLAAAPGLPQETQAAILWSGVGFKIIDQHLVAPLDQVLEVLPLSSLTLVPGVKSWVRGVVNVRGNLITIIDLSNYFGKPPVFLSESARLMVMNIPELQAGLLVNEVLGLRHFDEEVERRELPSWDDPAMMPCLSGAFQHNETLWGIFDMKSLAESLIFKHVAV